MEQTLTAFSALILFAGCFIACGGKRKPSETTDDTDEMISDQKVAEKKFD